MPRLSSRWDQERALSAAHLLDYYRRLGVEHFLVIDNQSPDATMAFLDGQEDVSTVLATANYGEARYGVDWLNGVLRRFCVGKWVLWVDADELLVFSEHQDVILTDRRRGSIN